MIKTVPPPSKIKLTGKGPIEQESPGPHDKCCNKIRGAPRGRFTPCLGRHQPAGLDIPVGKEKQEGHWRDWEQSVQSMSSKSMAVWDEEATRQYGRQ